MAFSSANGISRHADDVRLQSVKADPNGCEMRATIQNHNGNFAPSIQKPSVPKIGSYVV